MPQSNLKAPVGAAPKIHAKMVRPEGLEPPARGLGNRCSILLSYGRNILLTWSLESRLILATQTRPLPAVIRDHKVNNENGAPGGTRTPNLQIRSLLLYPIELRARKMAERAGFEPATEGFKPPVVA